MPKLKQPFDLASSSAGSGSGGGGASEQPASGEPERKRAKLNFSIESIMQSNASGRQQARLRSPSPQTSDESLLSPLGPRKSECDSASESAESSRASTPISPGRNPEHAERSPGRGCHARAAHSAGRPANAPSQPARAPQAQAKPVPGAGPSSTQDAESRLAGVECTLDNKDMWDKFHSLNTEMIITKTGRRMFPVMKVQFHNLEPAARYAVSMDIVPVDNKRYRYAYHKSCWQVAGKADPSAEPRLYPHPDSPFNGDLLARQVISFEKVKLTNNEMDKSGHIILNSMHKYQPRIHLIELKSAPAQHTPLSLSHPHPQQQQHHQQQQQHSQLGIEGYRTYVFPETVFTAVTAYQNQLITKMKIDKNPFAKGFRDSSRLSDLDRNDPFDYIGNMGPSARFLGPPGPASALDIASAAAAGAHMDTYQLLASAANNPWYSAAAVAAAATGSNPLNTMGAASSTAQAAQLQAQMWLAAVSACLNQGSASGAPNIPPVTSGSNSSASPASTLQAHLGQTKSDNPLH